MPPKARATPARAANDRQHHTLGERLTNQPAASGAESKSHGYLALPRRASGEQKVGHVHARDEQDETNRRRQNEQRRFHRCDHEIHQPHDVESARALRLEPANPSQPGHDRVRSRRAPPPPTRHPSSRAITGSRCRAIGLEVGSGIQNWSRGSGKANPRSMTPTTVYVVPSMPSRWPTMFGSAAKYLLPARVAENHHRLGARARLRASRRVARGVVESPSSTGGPATAWPRPAEPARARLVTVLIVGMCVPTCDSVVVCDANAATSDDVRPTTRRRPPPAPSDGGRCSTIRTTRSESGNGKGRNRTAFTTVKIAVFAPMPSASVSTATSVKPGLFASVRTAYRRSCWRWSIQHRRPDGPRILADPHDVAEGAARGVARIVGRRALRHALFGFELEMGANLARQIVVAVGWHCSSRGGPSSSLTILRRERLRSAYAGRSMRVIARAIARHRDSSTVSCLRPDGVRR